MKGATCRKQTATTAGQITRPAAGIRENHLFLFMFRPITHLSHSLLTQLEKHNSVPIHEVGQSDREQKTEMWEGPVLRPFSIFRSPGWRSAKA
jgi:hypothetical protein